MKKVGILNFHYSTHNYGAVLQAASLAKYIESLGYDVEHIDFIPQDDSKTLKRQLRTYLGKVARALKLLPPLSEKKQKGAKNNEVFDYFRYNWIKTSNEKFTTGDDLKRYNFEYDAVVVGSDQVWRPAYTTDNMMFYFLSFLPDNVRRVAYAASFGVSEWESKYNNKVNLVKKELEKFKAISVREDTGVSICEETFGVTSEHVLDPTLLVGREFFQSLLPVTSKLKYHKVVYYKLDVDAEFKLFIDKVSQSYSNSVENIYLEKTGADYSFYPVDMWVDKIAKSDVVITDSFHCVCLSILFEKEFVCIINENRGISRIKSLLHALGIEGRLFNNVNDIDFSKLEKIDYQNKVNDKLELLRESSSEFIKKALDE
ncbi:polysaccharide pyruvyl transferase family protein [Photobacterium gaetbulicola]|uniref:Polysaccharide pyruvyl transferase domain-containing protein n=1 Tax=Photobacterium gaetbulicola Gung47 TaxID=658445 RepID=A0A0C5X2C7_9GAMM|nr:polysaccharide pyruvyl transferase family protein [Photobacterium gaetbulicola]AJR09500.1 hypothetical protein H744_2c2847 [Photobacterium gaetbulicola Gung47]PSU14294.1 polysaccharide pyruvyl transferase family protein [Photobacterium gaetbulicola]